MVKHLDKSIQHIYINTTFAAIEIKKDMFSIKLNYYGKTENNQGR